MAARHISVIPRVPLTTRQAFLLIGALALSLPSVASTQERSLRVRNLHVVLAVNSDGSLDVTERLSMRFTGRWSKISRVLYRHKSAAGGWKEEYSELSATDGGGQPLRWEAYTGRKRSDRIFLGIWITPWPMNEDRDVILRYHVTNAVSFDELYWKINDRGYPIDRAHVVVVLPTGVVPARTAVYTRDGPGTHFPGFNPAAKIVADAKIETTDNTIGISLPRALSASEIMTVAVGWPSGHVRGPVAATRAPEEPGISMIQWWPLLFPLMVFVVAFKTWRKREEPNEESYDVRYEPAEEMSPAELGTLVDDSMDGADLTATLVDLAGRGFLRIEEVQERDLAGGAGSIDHIIYLIRRRTEWAGLKPHEFLYLSALSNAAGTSRLVRNSWLRKTMVWPEGIRDAIYESLVSSGHYSARPDKIRGLWNRAAIVTALAGIPIVWLAFRYSSALISPAMVTAAAVLSAFIPYAFARIMPARTAVGARARDNALGLQDFFSRVTDPRNTSTMNSPEKFQRYLPYAIALGVAGNWAKAFDDLYGGTPDWYVGGTGKFCASGFSRSISGIPSPARSRRFSRPRARR
jgi:hypothetical protein